MAYRRSIAVRAKLFYQQQQRLSPSISSIHRDDNDSGESQTRPISRYPQVPNYIQHRFHVAGNNFGNHRRSIGLLQDWRFAAPAGCGMSYVRNYSSAGFGEGAADNIDVMSDVVAVLGDTVVKAAPMVNEVAVAAADSYAPVAALQYMIDYVHFFTGLNWWASIVVTTLIIRTLMIPILINQLKANTQLALLRPELEAVKEEMENQGSSPSAVAEGQTKMKALFNSYGVTPWTPMKGILISGPIYFSFFFAITNMAEKVPSFKDGGILWFTDLSTPDSLYVLPVLTALTFWIMVEIGFIEALALVSYYRFQCNAQEGMEGNASAGTVKNVMRVFAAVSIPLTATFTKALFFYWLTSNMFSLAYSLTIKNPKVKEYLKLPIVPITPPRANQKPPLSFIESIKKFADDQARSYKKFQSKSSSSQPMTRRISPPKVAPPSSLPNPSVRSLEKKAKGKRKGKR